MQLFAELIESVQSLPEQVYGTIHSALINSTNDKDATVRVQVAIMLGNLACGEDLAVIEDDAVAYRYPLCSSTHSPTCAAPLRQMCTRNSISRPFPSFSHKSRTRMRPSVVPSSESSNLLLPARSLSLEQCTLLVRCGLGDRAPVVKAEASKLPAKWVDGTQDLEEFISLFDLSSDKTAEDALGAVLAGRQELLNDINLSTW